MRIFTTDQAVIAEGVRYLRIIAFTYVINGVSVTSINMLRTVGVVKISVVISSVSLVVNVFSNWVFIFGHLGAPALGIAGAALGTLIARVVEIIIVLVFMGFFERQIVFRPKDLFLKIDSQIKKNFVSYSCAMLLALLIKIAGYYIAEGLIYGNWAAPAASIPGNVVQVAAAMVIVMIVIVPLQKAASQILSEESR